MDNDLTLKAAALKFGFVTEAEFDRVVDPTEDGETLCGSRSEDCRCSLSAGKLYRDRELSKPKGE